MNAMQGSYLTCGFFSDSANCPLDPFNPDFELHLEVTSFELVSWGIFHFVIIHNSCSSKQSIGGHTHLWACLLFSIFTLIRQKHIHPLCHLKSFGKNSYFFFFPVLLLCQALWPQFTCALPLRSSKWWALNSLPGMLSTHNVAFLVAKLEIGGIGFKWNSSLNRALLSWSTTWHEVSWKINH